MNYKKYAVSSLLIASFLAPSFGLAQGTANDKANKAFCGRLDNLYANFTSRIAGKDDKITQKRDDIKQKLEDRWTSQNSKLAEKRDKWSQNREDHFAKLEEKAQTDAQKLAVTVFVQAVQAAIAARKAAIDKAITDFRLSMDEAKGYRQSRIDTAKFTFREAVEAAYEKAKSDCTNNVDVATIRSNLKNDLQAAKTKYHSDLKALEQLRIAVDDLIAVRKAAIERAIQDFKSAIEQAKKDFKTAVGQQSE